MTLSLQGLFLKTDLNHSDGPHNSGIKAIY